MIWSSTRPAARLARDVDELMAAEWAPAELLGSLSDDADDAAPADHEHADARATTSAAEAVAAEKERERLVSEAYERGYEEGRREGEIAEAARLRHALKLTEEALDQLREGEIRGAGAIEENICALAVAVARQLVGRELGGDAEGVLDLVRRALAEFPVDQPIRIRVNPQDLSVIESHGEEPGTAMAATTRGREARWVADARLAPGGCVVEGRERIVDGRVDTALERIYRRLTYTHV
jgi:flagellar biosynthesis/type III secretory pathway protein FliH